MVYTSMWEIGVCVEKTRRGGGLPMNTSVSK